MSNVVQFPLRRVLREQVLEALEAVPDTREVLSLADAFQLEAPSPDLRDRVEASVAAFVLGNVPPEKGGRRDAALRELLKAYTERSAAAEEVSRGAWVAAEAAQDVVLRRQQEHGTDAGLAILSGRANDLSNQAAQVTIEAYALSVERSAAARVVSLALRGEEWKPASRDDLWFGPTSRATGESA
ncbi:hypothetical protein WDZ11_22305 (plasmid) [Roseomonas mucosa]|uniref:hypothetical protein n=1 Tax=Roseomonas mucosa TaxID=207340 RepID=UPI0030CC6D36